MFIFMKTFFLNVRMKKTGWSFVMIPVLFALPNMALSQVAVKSPVCRPEPIQLLCNFSDGCDAPGATFTWHNANSSWITHVRDPILFPTGYPLTGDGQTTNVYGYCNGEGYATDWFYFDMHFSPPPDGHHSGSVHVMENSSNINISGDVKDYSGNPLPGGKAYLFNVINGVLDTSAIATIAGGHFTFWGTCGADGSPILVIPPAPVNPSQAMIPTYLGDTPSWSDATEIVASSSITVDMIHMIRKPSRSFAGGATADIKGTVFRNNNAKANDPIDNVGVVIRKKGNSALYGYEISDAAGSFDLGFYEQGDYVINSNYPGIPMYTKNDANIVRVYNAIDTINLAIRVVSDTITVDSNFVRVSPTYVVSPLCSVQNTMVSDGITNCYNALQSLTVSGNNQESVVVHDGGTAYFVAGQKINFKPGFRAENGSLVWGHITTTGQFCNRLLGSNNSLGGMTVSEGENSCFQAMDTLSAGGNGATFLVQSGSTAHLIAGKKIFLYPNTHAVSGATFHAYISTDGTYCDEPKSVTAENNGNEESIPDRAPSSDQTTFYKVYPNPTSGSITLELSVEPGESMVSADCYNNMGSLVLEKEFHSGKKHELSLDGHAPGIYLLRVRMNGEAGLTKIIKQ